MYTYRAYLVRRLAWGVLTVFAMSAIIFLIMHITPGSPQRAQFGRSEAEHQKGLQDVGRNDSLYVQYLQWIQDLATGHLGKTFSRSENVADLVWHRGPLSAEIGLLAVLLAWLVGLPVGIISALYPNSAIGIGARRMSVLFLAIPGFWLAMLIVLGLRFWFNYTYAAPLAVVHIWENPWENLRLVSGPAMVLGLGQAASMVRMARCSLMEILRQDGVYTAGAKGLPEWLVIVPHALPNTLLSVLTQSSPLVGCVLGGSVLIEQTFGVPGLGRTLVMAIAEGEKLMVQNLVFLYVLISVIINLLVDLSSAWFDPKQHGQRMTRDTYTASSLRSMATEKLQLRQALRGLQSFARHTPVAAFWGCVALTLFFVAIAAPWISPKDPLRTDFQRMARPPDAQSYLGTDLIGRDTLSRVIHGTSHSLMVAIAAVLLGTTTGALWGCASGYIGERFDRINQRLIAVLQSFPALILALAMVTAWGTDTGVLVMAIAMTCIPSGSQGIRAVSRTIKEMPHVKAARIIGVSPLRVLFLHIVPLYVVPYLTLATAHLRVAIILEASLDFLGLGTPLPAPTWGNMLADALASPMPPWWLVLFPGLAITVTLLAFNLFGNGIRDALHHGGADQTGGDFSALSIHEPQLPLVRGRKHQPAG